MNFSEVIGQEQVKAHLLHLISTQKIPHSLLLCGESGSGKMALALAFASFLLGDNDENNPRSANAKAMLAKWEHPDLHFVFPVIRPNGTSADHKTVSDDFIKEWRAMLCNDVYFSLDQWLNQMNANNQQAMIFEAESDNIAKKLSLKSSQGGYKVCIIWLPERMNVVCANKLLKILEEPPAQTLFIMVCEEPDKLLETVRSRTQRINVKRISTDIIAQKLIEKRGIDVDTAQRIATIANGNWLNAISMLSTDNENALFFHFFVQLMRLAYVKNIKELKAWSETVSAFGREKQKRMLSYFSRMFRENFMYNLKQPVLCHFTKEEEDFAKKFAPFINEANIIGLYELIEKSRRDLSQNANAKIVFFDLTIQLIVLLLKK